MLPTSSEINNFLSKVDSVIKFCLAFLNNDFSLDAWIKLNKLVLIYLMVFNRKRPGDLEKTELQEYHSLSSINEEL